MSPTQSSDHLESYIGKKKFPKFPPKIKIVKKIFFVGKWRISVTFLLEIFSLNSVISQKFDIIVRNHTIYNLNYDVMEKHISINHQSELSKRYFDFKMSEK